MSQWIRWKGVIPFVLITTGLALFFLLFVDSVVKNIIDSTGSEMIGAKVETKNVDVHLSPLGITVDGLQVTNPQQPMSNAIEIEQIRFGLAGDKLLMGQVIIEQMDVEHVRFDTPRNKSGAIAKPTPAPPKPAGKPAKDSVDRGAPSPSVSTTEAEKKDDGMKMPSLDLPDINTILNSEPLQTQKQADAISASITRTEQDWNALQQSLPDDARKKSYEQRVASLEKTKQDDIAQLTQALKTLQSLKSDLNTDIGVINHARKQAQLSLNKLDTDYKALLKAPGEDKQRLLNKYTPDAQGVGNLSQLLFGNEANGYLQQGLHWYKKLAPMLTGDEEEEEAEEAERLTGRDIRFRENNPTPDFLIRRIHTSVQTTQGDFEGQILDVTHQPEIIRRPVSFVFSGQQMRGMDSLHIQGKLDHIDKKNTLDEVDMDLTRYKVARHSLSNDPNLQLVIDSALSNTRMRVKRRNGRLNGDMNIHISDIQYDNRAGGGEFQQVLVTAFNNVHDFNIDTYLSGSLEKPGLRIRSDLDQRLNKQVSAAFNRRIDKYKQELNSRIEAATEKQIAPVRASVEKLRTDIETQLKATEASYQNQRSAIDTQLGQYQTRLDKIKREYQAKSDAEKRKAEQAVKQQLEDKAKDLLKQFQR
ncbi:MAG: TIGR03545 family protein [Gammaproteobacteria bacterium]|nr:TIGR03545 family protein [Gammaproteobacteria bacterium]